MAAAGVASTSGAGPASSVPSSEAAAADAGVEPVHTPIPPGQLTAGEWSDLEHWSFWHDLQRDCGDPQQPCKAGGIGKQQSAHWGFASDGRVPVVVKAGEDAVVDAKVTLLDANQQTVWEARTDHAGHAELFAGMFGASSGPYQVTVTAGDDNAEADGVTPDAAHPIELSLPSTHAPAPSLDLMFVIDTTGSMGDELSYIQSELDDVIQRVRDDVGSQLALRVSVNFYRDRDMGDAYVVRPFAFTSDVATAQSELKAQNAMGGGDIPEAVEEALADAIEQHDWREAASARILFLVLDAPPHDTDSRIATLHRVTQAAAKLGVAIVPVAASGVDKSTEFLLRNFAIATNGTYTFLTDDSGIGNSHIEPTIGHYDVELLNELLARVIADRL